MDYKVEDSPGFLLNLAALKVRNMFMDKISDYSITAEQWFVLYMIKRTEGMTQNEMSALIGREKSNTARIIKRMSDKGLIMRKRDVKDSRAKRLYLTLEGERILVELIEIASKSKEEVTAFLGDEDTESLKILLKKIIVGISDVKFGAVTEDLISENKKTE